MLSVPLLETYSRGGGISSSWSSSTTWAPIATQVWPLVLLPVAHYMRSWSLIEEASEALLIYVPSHALGQSLQMS